MAFRNFNDFSGYGWLPMNIHSGVHLNSYDMDYVSRTRSGAWKKLMNNLNQGGLNFTRRQWYNRGWRVVKIYVQLCRTVW